MNGPAPGWYVNPSGPGRRYWDGERWTEHVDETVAVGPYTSPAGSAPPPPPPPPTPGPVAYTGGVPYGAPPQAPGAHAAPSQGLSGLVVVGYVTAVLLPIVGFVLGIVCATRRDEPQTARHGVWVIIVSVVAFVVWLAILSANRSGYGY
jgi:hypothetical protein